MTQQLPDTQFAKNQRNRLVIRPPGTLIRLVLPNGQPVARADFTLIKPNGEQIQGKLDDQGYYQLTTKAVKEAEPEGWIILFDQGVAIAEADVNPDAGASTATSANQKVPS